MPTSRSASRFIGSRCLFEPQPGGRITEQRVAFGVVALNPCGGELYVGDVGAVFDLLEHSGERHRQRGESLVEILQRKADWLAGKNVADRVLERDQLRTGSRLPDRVIPRATSGA